MENLWKKKFKPLEIQTPKDIIECQCNYLEESTKGDIVAKVLEYNGRIVSLYKPGFLTETFGQFQDQLPILDTIEDIQNDLGELESSNFTFEFFITSRHTPNYKYRVMFIRYGISFYPTLIVLDESISNELGVGQRVEIQTQEEFEKILRKILNSAKLEKVITSLLAIAEKEVTWY